MRTFLAGLIILLLTLSGYSQESNEISNRIGSGKIFTTELELGDWIKVCKGDTVTFFLNLKSAKIDSLSEEKLSSSFYLLKRLVAKQTSSKVKRAAASFFIASAKSNHSIVRNLSFKSLNSLPSYSFDGANMDSISSLISKYPKTYADAVLLAGKISNPVYIERIKNVFPNGRRFSKQEQWATYKALARLGDKEALDFCINRISSLPMSDQVVDNLFPDLIYIHTKEAFAVLIKEMNSDEKLCSSSNPNSDGKIICGYRIMELLASVIEGFPLKVLPSGDLDTKDYSKALQEARAWFAKMGSNYIIKN